MEIDKHFIKNKIDYGDICMPFVLTTQQIAQGLFESNFCTSWEQGVFDVGVNHDILGFYYYHFR